MFKRDKNTLHPDWQSRYASKALEVSDPALKHYFSQPLPAPETAIENITFLAMDFETTGLDPFKNEIITIGTVPFTLNRILLNQAKHWTVRPRKALNEQSVVIHGITHNDLMGAPDFSAVFPKVLEQMAGHVCVVHYHPIERGFLDHALRLRIGEGIEFPVVDTMDIESRLYEKSYSGLVNWIKGKKKPSMRLGQTRTRYGLPPYTPHQALTDAIATAELLQAQLAYHYPKGTRLKEIWI
ncbi:3'-5' exonuclease [Vibrio sonorensis]|uniref:3'-5' exonuclease n=1 Tax=Vibrio sonorensis TaxID=1004316 RepID=UPI0008D93FB7|nr:3'-5' exonuclease [Vibrio sonorensis]